MGLFGDSMNDDNLLGVDDAGLGTSEEEYQPKGLMKVLDILMRPNYASAGFAKKIAEGNPDEALSSAWNGLMGREKNTYRDVLTAAGWKDEDDIKMSDAAPSFYSETGEEWTKFKKDGFMDFGAKGTVGLLGDIFLDPSFYATLGGSKAGAKGLSLAKKHVKPMAEQLSRIMAKGGEGATKNIIKELAPWVIHKSADEWTTSLANKLISKQGVIPEIAEELAKNIARKHTVTFFGKQVLPEFIDRPIVDTTAKLLAAAGETKSARMIKELFVMGGANPFIRLAKVAAIGNDAHAIQMMREHHGQLVAMGKGINKKQRKGMMEALYWLDDVADGNPSYIDKAVEKFGLDDKVVKMMNKIGDLQDISIKAKQKANLAGELTKPLKEFSRWHMSKTMTEEGMELFSKTIKQLESNSLKRMVRGTSTKGGDKILKVLDEAEMMEVTADWIFKVPKEMLDKNPGGEKEMLKVMYDELMGVLNKDPEAFSMLGKLPKLDLEKGLFTVPRYGIETGAALNSIDEFAEATGAVLRPWTIEKSNEQMYKTFVGEADQWLKSELPEMRAWGKKMKNLPKDFKFFFDDAENIFPAKFLKDMQNVRNKGFIDDLTTRFSYKPSEIFGSGETRDFVTKASRKYVEGSPAWEAARIDQMFKKVEESLAGIGVNKQQLDSIRANMTKRIHSGTYSTIKIDDYISGIKQFDEDALKLSEIIPDFHKAKEAKAVMRQSMSVFEPDVNQLRKTLMEAPIDGFNLKEFERIEKAVRTLEKQGKSVGVYVPEDQWTKLYKDFGVKGGKFEELTAIFEKGDLGNGHYLLNMDKLDDFAEAFPSITKDIKVSIMEKDALKEMHASYNTLSSHKEVKAIGKMFKSVYKLWKGHALVSPGYHFRNMVGNTSLNYLGGVTNPKNYLDSYNMQRMASRIYGGTASKKQLARWNGKYMGTGKTMKQIWGEMGEQGIINRGFFAADLTRSMYDELANPKILNVFSSRHILLEKNRVIGEMVESNARIAHYLNKRAKGFSNVQSGQSVRKYLFDYADLSEVEKKYGKAVMPFYTFMRKNIPLQLETMVKNPGKQALWGKLIKATQGNLENEALLPEWMKDQGGIQIGETEDGLPRYFPLQSYLPFADVTKLTTKGMSNTLLSQMNPLMKLPIELMSPKGGFNSFFGKPIEAFEGETEDFAGLQKMGSLFGGTTEKMIGKIKFRKKMTHVLRLVREFNELDRMVGVRSKGLNVGERLTRFVTGMRLYPFDEAKESKYLKRQFERETKRIKSISKHLNPIEKKRAMEKVRELTKDFQKTFSRAYKN